MIARVFSIGVRGVQGYPVLVELDLANGLPAYTTVGLPDDAVRESRERVAAAVRNSGYRFPSRRITVNLAPAQSRKQGTQFDLPIALSLLTASGQVPCQPEGSGDRLWSDTHCFVGELALDGRLRPVPGVLAMALEARAQGFSALVVPDGNAEEAGAVGLRVLGASCLREVADLLSGAGAAAVEKNGGAAGARRPPVCWSGLVGPDPDAAEESLIASSRGSVEDLSDVKGQALAKRALEIAAAGGHNLLLVGPPGVGKSMLARRLSTILPPLTPGEALEVTRVHSLAGLGPKRGLVRAAPFRAPHHSASKAALVGGGPSGRPGEASLAHGGVLFLDELAEFGRSVLEALRQPLEDFKLTVARARDTVEYPARFLLVAATNPCPCGWRGHPERACLCAPAVVEKYLGRLSGPLLDRIDLQVELAPLRFEHWAGVSGGPAAQSSRETRERVLAARRRQKERFGAADFAVNAYIQPRDLARRCPLDREGLAVLEAASRRLSLSARSLDRVLRAARTIADLAGSEDVRTEHLAEAVQYRCLDRRGGGLS